MEYVREHRFSVYIDTNKRTIEKSFDSLRELVEYVKDLAASDDAFHFVDGQE